MARYAGGTVVKSGYYWSMSRWSLTGIPADGGALPGSAHEQFTQVPVWAAMLLAPIMGGLFVLFMPFIGIYLTVKAVAGLVTGGARKSASELAATVSPGAFVPGAAGLTGKPEAEKKDGAAPAGSESIEKLAKEIEEKRK
ncbi:hypothetical protein [Anaeromyxobacter paludicola]|uniref:Uncharacterized protein n=1 Tax=Anaeromyxobacter paludicola TaxID=2918171 RepID=A0ABM7X6E6_9BACT|nr:hypothetical protein [Anaeromyxobacter paludicola]BDG07391.1 hypothetical protein AMPC_05040 [Anaeromyxobacter paludicola]